MLGLAITACAPHKAGNVNNGSDELAMLVGTYTDGNSKGIYTFRFNQETGLATSLSSIEVLNPSYLIPSEDGKFVYAVSEMNDTTAALNAFSFDKETGKLSLLNRQPTMGADPCYVATNGKEVLTANYSGGSMSIFPLKKNGSLEPIDTLFEGSTGGPDAERQATPHVHCTVFSPDGKYIFATDFSADRILRFVIHPKSIIPHPSAEAIDVDPNSGPRHLTFSPNGKYAYLISELSGNITAFSYLDGKLEKIQTIAADTLRARGSADIHLSPDGKYLYYVSDAVGGFGGKDIFRSRLVGNDFGPMENLGPDINTPGDEMFPYVRDSVTLYFASNGHPGMGGLDLFKATQDSTGKWHVENLKAPINSMGDDFGITFEGDKEKGFFSSNRNDARGYDHLYFH